MVRTQHGLRVISLELALAQSWHPSQLQSNRGQVAVRKRRIAVLAFMGRLSTNMPLRSLAAFAARSGFPKIMSAMPRLAPFWLYWRETFLTLPTDLLKYSYSWYSDQYRLR